MGTQVKTTLDQFGQQYTAEQLSSEILKALRQDAVNLKTAPRSTWLLLCLHCLNYRKVMPLPRRAVWRVLKVTIITRACGLRFSGPVGASRIMPLPG